MFRFFFCCFQHKEIGCIVVKGLKKKGHSLSLLSSSPSLSLSFASSSSFLFFLWRKKREKEGRRRRKKAEGSRGREGTEPFSVHIVVLIKFFLDLVMILPQVHLRKPCYDFYFL